MPKCASIDIRCQRTFAMSKAFNAPGRSLVSVQHGAADRGYEPSGSASRFAEYASDLVDEWLKLKQARSSRRAEGANAWLRREAYHLLVTYIEAGRVAAFERLAYQDRRPNRTIVVSAKNLFKLGLLAMFSDDSVLSRADRSVFGNQMLWAWAHNVPVDFLNAFLAVTGGPASIARKLKLREPEPGFEHRFDRARLPQLGD